MNRTLTLCKSLIISVFIMFILVACGEEKQSATTADKSTAPAAASEQTQGKPEEVEAQATAEPITAPKPEAADTQASKSEPVQAEPVQEKTPTQASTALQQDDMLALAKKSGCMACHAVDRKIVGPAWKDVAKRYSGNAAARDQLIEKVSKGGKGNWSEVVGSAAMPPYYPRVSKENIGKLVDFVLSLPE
ncbi:c-type cytochrome [Kaarinaea lacus]